jgi:hypothetical protein
MGGLNMCKKTLNMAVDNYHPALSFFDSNLSSFLVEDCEAGK